MLLGQKTLWAKDGSLMSVQLKTSWMLEGLLNFVLCMWLLLVLFSLPLLHTFVPHATDLNMAHVLGLLPDCLLLLSTNPLNTPCNLHAHHLLLFVSNAKVELLQRIQETCTMLSV